MILKHRLRLLFWETTAGCNLACIHCRRLDAATEMMKNDLTPAETFAFVDQLASLGPLILVLSGGEPLIRKDIFDIAQYAAWRGLTVALATNGTLIDKNIAERIRESGIHRVAVSIDGADTLTHDDFRRQPGSLNAAIRGMDECRKKGLSLQINCTITRHNAHQLNELYALAVRMGAEAMHFFMLVPVGCGMSIADSHMLPAEKYEEVLNWIYDRAFGGACVAPSTGEAGWSLPLNAPSGLDKERQMFVKATCAPHYFRVVSQRRKLEARMGGAGFSEKALGAACNGKPYGTASGESAGGQPPAIEAAGPPVSTKKQHPPSLHAFTRGCLAGTDICFVSHQGDVFPCGYLPVSAGNIRQQSFPDIWETSPLWNGFRNTDLLKGKCGACEFKNICLGCRARAFYQTGDFLAEEPSCIYEPVAMRKSRGADD